MQKHKYSNFVVGHLGCLMQSKGLIHEIRSYLMLHGLENYRNHSQKNSIRNLTRISYVNSCGNKIILINR